jgi:hypothetical protein
MNEDALAAEDSRLYAHQPDTWTAHVKQTAEKEYCYIQAPEDEHFHLLMRGEIYLVHQDEKYCINCALRHSGLTRNRLHWQRS